MMHRAGLLLLVLLCLAAVSGCAVGPDFRTPKTPAVTAYTPLPLPSATEGASVAGGEAQRFVEGGEVPSRWWMLFGSTSLAQLIARALEQSPNLAAAQAALRQAAELRRAQVGAFFPNLDANLSATRSAFTGASFGQPQFPTSIFTLYNASVSISYNLDPFGGNRRRLEALQSQLNYETFLLEGARLTLVSNLVTTAVREGSLRAQIQATEAIIASEEEQLKLVQLRFGFGAASRTDLLAQQAQLAQARAMLPPLEKDLAQTRHQLAVLAGMPPSAAANLPRFELSDLQLPRELPVSLPSALLRQRPDLRASEELLHEASAQIGVATAALYPNLNLTGNYGSQSITAGSLFSAGTMAWSIGAGLVQPIFHGGELKAKKRAAMAAYEQAEAQYRETVLTAFQNVADVLRALDLDSRTLKAQAEAEGAAQSSLEVAREEYRLGAASYLTLLAATQQHQRAKLTLIQARAARLADSAALFQALGGGWWNREKK